MSAVLERLRAIDATQGASSGRDPEIQGMLDGFDMLAEAQAVTGESGRASGNYVAFDSCPVCGHRDCFRVYPQSQSWACFGASNSTGFTGGSVLDFWQATGRARDNAEAVKLLREATGNRREDKADGENHRPKLLLPRWQGVQAANPPKRRPSLVDGILRCGHVALISGKAKSCKSWLALNLSVCVSLGIPWLGRPCAQGRVLFIDPELDERSLDNRIHAVCVALGVDAREAEQRIVRWSLRGATLQDGSAPTMRDVVHDMAQLKAAGELGEFALVVIDSCSALLAGDENASGDVRAFTNACLKVAELTGGAVLLTHHMGKGAAGDRDAIERARGSSVWGDAPDAPLSLTEIFPPSGEAGDYLQEGERAFVLEDSGLREFPSMEPLHVIFRYPVHRIDADGITADWKPKTSQQKAGRASGQSRKDAATLKRLSCEVALLAHFQTHGIGAEGVAAKEAAAICSEALGKSINGTTLKRLFEDEPSASITVYQKSARRCYFVPTHLPHA